MGSRDMHNNNMYMYMNSVPALHDLGGREPISPTVVEVSVLFIEVKRSSILQMERGS